MIIYSDTFERKKMPIIDLTHPIHAGMPVYPGKPQPVVVQSAEIENEGYRELTLGFDGHTGTHMDAPAHMLPMGKTLDKLPVSHFYGDAAVILIPEHTAVIGISKLEPFRETISAAEYVLLVTGWSKYWGTENYQTGFPVLSEEAARWLVSFPLKGIGIDAISVDSLDSETWQVHHILFNAGFIIVENLRFPAGFNVDKCRFICLPLLVKNSDGAPVRAVVQIDEKQSSELSFL